MSNLDIEHRLILAFKALIAGTAAIAAIVSTRVYSHGDKTNKAAYPAVTVQVPSCPTMDWKLGWYRATVNVIAHTYLHDDPAQSSLRNLTGLLRELFNDTSAATNLNNTSPAKATATVLTVKDVLCMDSFEESPEENVRTIGLVLEVVARPSTGSNSG